MISDENEDADIEKQLASLKAVKKWQQLFKKYRKWSSLMNSTSYGQQVQTFVKLFKKWKIMVKQFVVSQSANVFKTSIVKFINNYQKMKKSSVFLHFWKRKLKLINDTCKENTTEFTFAIKTCLKATSKFFGYFWLAILVH